MRAYLFPGQGCQYVGMGKVLYQHSLRTRQMLIKANDILDMDLTQIMLDGSIQVLQETAVAQPAVFVYSVIMALVTAQEFHAVAGHSLGEISALVANQMLSFEDGLDLVAARSNAMQQACQSSPGTMVAVLGLSDEVVAAICAEITSEVVLPANYNCPGQVVISGSSSGIQLAELALQKAGARKIIPLKVAGGFHSPLMHSAQESFARALEEIPIAKGICPIYQNVTALPITDPVKVKEQLLQQLVSPVYWTLTIQNMVKDGVVECIECGPGTVLQGLVKKIHPGMSISQACLHSS